MSKLILPSQSEKPAAISAPMKLQLIGGKGTIGSYATLSLKNPLVQGKAELRFLSPLFISADEEGTPLPLFGDTFGFLSVRINAESANSLYLVDCAVSPKTTTFSITELGGDVKPQDVNAKNGHLLFLLEAPSAGWYEYTIANQNVGWTLLLHCVVSKVMCRSDKPLYREGTVSL